MAHEGYDPSFGARPLKRVIQREIADPASLLILSGSAVEGSTVTVDVVTSDGHSELTLTTS
jgi:ATP-dependent Clp protease ATP-binding subunit ClpB